MGPRRSAANEFGLAHVVLIPDGNARWARTHNLPILEGHRRGAEAVKRFLNVCREQKIQVATVWAFSTENWRRPKVEVDGIMNLVYLTLRQNREDFHKNRMRLVTLGRKDRIRSGYPRLSRYIAKLEEETRDYSDFTLNIAIDYGGRDEIVRALGRLVESGVPADAVGYETLQSYLDTNGQADPDLIIRTSGEMRLSGILPLQSEYAELYFTPVLLPDLREEDVLQAFQEFLARQRRFGTRPRATEKGTT